MKERDPLEQFGQFVMAKLRDRAIEHHDLLADGYWKAPSLRQLQTDLKTLSKEQLLIVRRCVVNAIDTAIHDFLFALQELGDFDNDIRVMAQGQDIAELSDGLHGEPFADDGWFAKYSLWQASGRGLESRLSSDFQIMATLAQAVRMALHYGEEHLGVTDIFGEDVGPPLGGVFTATQGLKTAWNSPLDERGIIGMAMG